MKELKPRNEIMLQVNSDPLGRRYGKEQERDQAISSLCSSEIALRFWQRREDCVYLFLSLDQPGYRYHLLCTAGLNQNTWNCDNLKLSDLTPGSCTMDFYFWDYQKVWLHNYI
ncbi:hypothetical protein AV530_005352 [Patagioenas fasciata monilis]|uniref:Uncharacterized protein n=1 Tax=Patagioenas fasciata monilis TaxID=372326 RepID=A0A1V4JLE5_PATFA|nr:hypothetical protein AV530_005352 [Patagioenas fasciata monilis]